MGTTSEYLGVREAGDTLGFVYNLPGIDSQTAFDANCNERHGFWEGGGRCAAGTLGGAILGGLTGSSAGPIGTILGTIGGGLAGAAASCNSDEDGCGSRGARERPGRLVH